MFIGGYVYHAYTLHIMHTLAHTYQFFSSPWARALNHYEVSMLWSRMGWTSAHHYERTLPIQQDCRCISFHVNLQFFHVTLVAAEAAAHSTCLLTVSANCHSLSWTLRKCLNVIWPNMNKLFAALLSVRNRIQIEYLLQPK